MSKPSENLRDYALGFVGLPYMWGGDDPIKGFDCSGLVQELLSSEGMDPPGDQTAQGLYDYFKNRSMPNIRGLGALGFYGKSVDDITHVVMFLNDWQMVEAGGGTSKTTSLEAAAAQNAYIRLRHFQRRPDLVAVLNPFMV